MPLEMIEKAKDKGVKLLLPTDTRGRHGVLPPTPRAASVPTGAIPDDMEGMDIGPETTARVLRGRQGRGHRRLERPDGRVRV